MSKFAEIDDAIVKLVRARPGIHFRDVLNGVGHIAAKIPAGGDSMRIIDRRLQALRKRHLIAYSRGGWRAE